jgi:hypothetical protein
MSPASIFRLMTTDSGCTGGSISTPEARPRSNPRHAAHEPLLTPTSAAVGQGCQRPLTTGWLVPLLLCAVCVCCCCCCCCCGGLTAAAARAEYLADDAMPLLRHDKHCNAPPACPPTDRTSSNNALLTAAASSVCYSGRGWPGATATGFAGRQSYAHTSDTSQILPRSWGLAVRELLLAARPKFTGIYVGNGLRFAEIRLSRLKKHTHTHTSDTHARLPTSESGCGRPAPRRPCCCSIAVTCNLHTAVVICPTAPARIDRAPVHGPVWLGLLAGGRP